MGSITIQLAKMIGLTVIATASRPETVKWVRDLGADFAPDHRQPLPPQLEKLAHKEVDYIADFASTDQYWAPMAEMIKPQGHIVCLVDNVNPVDLKALKRKSASLHWEFMFARPMYQTPDMEQQGVLLNEVADLIDAGKLRATHTETLTPINAANLRAVHAKLESGTAIGKITLAGW